MTVECPNYDKCGGELRFSIQPFFDGAGEWSTFRGYTAELTDQTCACELTDDQYERLEQEIFDDDASYDYEPSYD